MNKMKLLVLLSLISIQGLAADSNKSEPLKTTYTASDIVGCIKADGQVLLDIGSKVESGSLEVTDLGDTSIVYKLTVAAEIKGVRCGFSMTGFAPKVTSVATDKGVSIHHGFVANKAALVPSACAQALNLSEDSITLIRNDNEGSIIVKGVEQGAPYKECGALVFQKN